MSHGVLPVSHDLGYGMITAQWLKSSYSNSFNMIILDFNPCNTKKCLYKLCSFFFLFDCSGLLLGLWPAWLQVPLSASYYVNTLKHCFLERAFPLSLNPTNDQQKEYKHRAASGSQLWYNKTRQTETSSKAIPHPPVVPIKSSPSQTPEQQHLRECSEAGALFSLPFLKKCQLSHSFALNPKRIQSLKTCLVSEVRFFNFAL